MWLLAVILVLSPITGDQFSNCSSTGVCYQSCSFELEECDSLPSIPSNLSDNQIVMFKTSHDGEKFTKYYLNWANDQTKLKINSDIVTLNILSNKTYQQIKGFGGAFTDSVSYNLFNLNSNKLKYQILESYFSWIDINKNGSGGSGYTYGRVPIASCDFSLYPYTYSSVENDFNLNNFSLNNVWDIGDEYGRIHVINMCKSIVSSTNPYPYNDTKLHLYGSPWTAPPWMKDNHKYYNGGKLNSNRTYWKTYSLYFLKYLQQYKLYGNITFDAISIQNEPNLPAPWESTSWTTKEMTEFIGKYLGPLLKEYNMSNVGIWIHDGQKGDLPEEVYGYFNYYAEYNVSQYITGLGIHWYFYPPPIPGCPEFECTGSFDQVNAMRNYLDNIIHRNDIYIMGTEACEGGTNSIKSPPNRGVSLGDWYRGQQYAEDIIGDINNGVSGWIDWNLVLNISGGPNHANNTCDAPIVIDFDNNVYYKQPMYYLMAHISRYIRPKSVVIGIQIDNNGVIDIGNDIWCTAVVDSRMKKTIVVIMNTNQNQSYNLQIKDQKKGITYLALTPHSIYTLLYNNLQEPTFYSKNG